MTLPNGQLSLSQVNTELSRPAGQQISMSDGSVRNLAGAGAQISMSQLLGKSSFTITAPGSYYPNSTNFSLYASSPVIWTWTRAGSPGGATPSSGSLATTWRGSVSVPSTVTGERIAEFTVRATNPNTGLTYDYYVQCYYAGRQ